MVNLNIPLKLSPSSDGSKGTHNLVPKPESGATKFSKVSPAKSGETTSKHAIERYGERFSAFTRALNDLISALRKQRAAMIENRKVRDEVSTDAFVVRVCLT